MAQSLITSQKVQTNNENPFLRKIPQYLDPTSLYNGLTPEKKAYIEFIKSLVKWIDFTKKDRIAIFGVGRGLESQVIAEALDSRQTNGEPYLTDTKLQSIDISSAILENLRKSAFSDRIKSGLVHANLLNLPKNIFPHNSYNLIAMSSILHEIQSEKNWQGAVSVFREAERILAPGGYIVIRDFYIPTSARQILAFKTPLAKKFFQYFCLNFQHAKGTNWQKEWLLINKNRIESSSAFAFELLQHFRMFYRNYYKNLGEKVFNFFAQWQELHESYSLMPNRSVSTVPEIIKSLGETIKTNYACAYFFTFDNGEDQILMNNFSCSELSLKTGQQIKSGLFPTKKIVIVLYKFPPKIKKEDSSDIELKKLLSSLTDRTLNIF